MPLPRHIYEELERVVGPANISDRPYILAGVRAAMPGGPKPPSPEAVLLPGSAEEVQQIVKICNRHKVSYIAAVSSLIHFAYPTGPGTVILQMKRMNQIEEINVEGRYAVIQPGVRPASQPPPKHSGVCTAIPIAGHKRSRTRLIRRQYQIRADSHFVRFFAYSAVFIVFQRGSNELEKTAPAARAARSRGSLCMHA